MTGDFQITVISFGYKTENIPVSNLLFDVRFLKNPYWDEKLRPFSGLDSNVQEYVLSQPAAVDFLNLLFPFLNTFIDCFQQSDATEIKIAFGCTGGRHRSVAIVGAVVKALQTSRTGATITALHRELSAH